MKKIFSLLFISTIVSCGTAEQEPEHEAAAVEVKKVVPEKTELEKLNLEASRLRAGGSVKEVTIKEGKATITYVKNQKEYKELNPNSSLSEADRDSYWDSEKTIKKALIDGPTRIMMKLDFINEVEINLPIKGVNYSIKVNKAELEKYTKTDFESIKEDYDGKFNNPYVYNEDGRNKFFTKFGKKK